MSLPKFTAAYADVQAILDTVLRTDKWPATFSLSTPAAAQYWRMRAYSLRALLRRQEEQRLGVRSGLGTSDYDLLVFTLDGRTVIINQQATESPGLLICGGEPIEVEANPQVPTSSMELSDDPDPFDL